jgi:hypothetical protein
MRFACCIRTATSHKIRNMYRFSTEKNWLFENFSILRLYIYCLHSLISCLSHHSPKLLPKPAPHMVRSRASSFKCEYPLLSLKSSSIFLRFLPRLPLTSIPPFIFPSITRCRRQFLRRMWPIQLAFRFSYFIHILPMVLNCFVLKEGFSVRWGLRRKLKYMSSLYETKSRQTWVSSLTWISCWTHESLFCKF